ncbi:MAG: 50S ribosomal protein L24 [Candidatus Sungbacteria bacterium RIFCSPLOWO2_01_FULL_60_25]|uniref:Large ribosomal subunit protein uL24 n=1 Tax=Candidatus Sungbacteria bacterium RIFCSPLOWO2_01_FULL_60_25 TaxID=1802281 RepID=A0A1G2LFF0_9BACT|nr:MAG: 50S ribosomal protein L24 [Candidatus Sungbacteria bacterium RIFCSPLOWO2_01_FULL_60_25]
MKIKKGDTVEILSGKDRGKRGKVIRVLAAENRVLVEGANLKKKHRKSRRQDRKGEIILIPGPLAVSAVAVVCGSCGKPTRVGYATNASGAKTRICKRCAKEL